MNYIEFNTDLQGKLPFANDVITAQLAEIGFESFTSEGRKYQAYIQEPLFNQEQLNGAVILIEEIIGAIEYATTTIIAKNWNAEWESQFEPVTVDNSIIICAPFHTLDTSAFTYDIIIEPKMSFGTGHHETTFLVLQSMLNIDFKGKTVVDCGCGTGVLGIAASLMGASQVFGFDYDPLCYENTIENIEKNKITNMDVALGGVDIISGKKFDIILANINRNILVQNMHFFAQSLPVGGSLIMSGFYEKDVEIVKKQSLENDLKFVSFNSKNNWSTILIQK